MAANKKTTKSKKKLSIKVRMIGELIDVTGSSKDSWNPAEISDDMKAISYIRKLADTWNPAQLNEALKYLGFKTVDTWNPAELEETKNKLVKYFLPTDASGNPIELYLRGSLPYEVTTLTIDLLPVQDLNGYDYPWAGGAGINKLNLADMSGSANNYYFQFGTGYALTAGQTYTFSADITASVEPFNFSIGVGDTNYELDIAVNNNLMNGHKTMTFTPTEAQLSGRPNMFIRVPRYSQITNFTYSVKNIQLELGSTAHDFSPYSNICPITGHDSVRLTVNSDDTEITFEQTVYGGTVDVLEGGTSSTYGYIESYDGEELPGAWISDRDAYAAGTSPTTGAEVAYILATPGTLTTSAEEVTLINGENTLSTDGNIINITYKANLNS